MVFSSVVGDTPARLHHGNGSAGMSSDKKDEARNGSATVAPTRAIELQRCTTIIVITSSRTSITSGVGRFTSAAMEKVVRQSDTHAERSNDSSRR